MQSTADIVHAGQWGALRAWVESVPRDRRGDPSTLDGWTVDDLLSHLARSVDAIGALRPASASIGRTADDGSVGRPADDGSVGRPADDGPADPDDDIEDTIPLTAIPETTTPLTIGAYLAAFSDRAEEIAEATKRAASASAADRSGELDAAYARAQRTLSALGDADPLVLARGGLIRLSDFIETRIIELVVHAGDLASSLPDLPPPPVLPAATDRVETVLRQAFRDKAGVLGDDAEVARMPAAEFIEVASGRAPVPDRLSAAVRSNFPLF